MNRDQKIAFWVCQVQISFWHAWYIYEGLSPIWEGVPDYIKFRIGNAYPFYWGLPEFDWYLLGLAAFLWVVGTVINLKYWQRH